MHFNVFFRVSSGFSSITSEQVVESIRKIDNFGPRKITHPVKYDSSIFIDVPRSSLRTNKQTDILILLIYRGQGKGDSSSHNFQCKQGRNRSLSAIQGHLLCYFNGNLLQFGMDDVIFLQKYSVKVKNFFILAESDHQWRFY